MTPLSPDLTSAILRWLDVPAGRPGVRHLSSLLPATEAEYGPNGLFLESVIVNKVVGDRQCRFNSADRPWRIHWDTRRERGEIPLLSADLSSWLASFFGMDEAILASALAVVA
jgi:hypothetical protein